MVLEAGLRRPVFAWRPTALLILYTVIVAISFLAYGANSFFVRDALITTLAILPFTLKFKVDSRTPYLLIASAFACGLDAFIDNGGRFGELGISLGQSQATAETTFGLLTPLLCIYFLIARKFGVATLCAFLALMMFKRIAFAAFMVAAAACYLEYHAKSLIARRLWKLAIVMSIFAVCGLSVYINSAYEIMVTPYNDYVKPGTTINNFTSGRYSIYEFIWRNYLDHQSLLQLVFGNGVASSSMMMSQPSVLSFSHVSLLHNDWFRILIEYGLIGLFLVLATFSRLSHGPMAIAAIVYTTILFATDNVAMYVFYWTLFLILLRSCPVELSHENTRTA